MVGIFALLAGTAAWPLARHADGAQGRLHRGDAFIAQHGSWNRKPHSGYNVVFVPFVDGRPSGLPVDIVTGFLDREGNALRRPVGVVVDKEGALLVADAVGNVVWRVTPAGP
jgi:glucose/arabinose dehydrogenase